jgi:hypothetical protein
MSADRRWPMPLFNLIKIHAELAVRVKRITFFTAILLTLWPSGGRAQNVTATVNIAGGSTPAALAVNPVTNKIYVASGPIAVIDGVTNATTSISVGSVPGAVAVNPVTNKIYVANTGIVWVLPMLLILLWLWRRRQTEARAWAARPAIAVPVLLLAMVGAAAGGCGSGSTTPPPVNNGTPTGTYSLTVTVSTPSNLTHSQQLTLVVQ